METLPAHLTYKCDGCLYNEFCLKWSAERDDLSLLPHITAQDKGALLRAGVATIREVAALKARPLPVNGAKQSDELAPAAGNEALVRQLSVTWPVGPHLDELVHRAQRYRSWKGDPYPALSYIPHRGYGSLPYCAPDEPGICAGRLRALLAAASPPDRDIRLLCRRQPVRSRRSCLGTCSPPGHSWPSHSHLRGGERLGVPVVGCGAFRCAWAATIGPFPALATPRR
jgi:hypothetical protein